MVFDTETNISTDLSCLAKKKSIELSLCTSPTTNLKGKEDNTSKTLTCHAGGPLDLIVSALFA